MHSRTIILAVAACLAGSALAADKSAPVTAPTSLWKRQSGSQAFSPENETRQGDTCEEAWGEGSRDCGPREKNLCWNPNDGHSCCEDKWACPEDSFCLVDGKCCPKGLNPKDCAAQNGVSLPSDFKVSTGSYTAASSSSTGYPSMSTPAYTSANSTSTYKATSTTKSHATTTGYTGTSTRPVTSYATGYNGTATSSGYGANNTTVAAFTGAAQPNAVAAGGLVAAVVGALGLVGNLL